MPSFADFAFRCGSHTDVAQAAEAAALRLFGEMHTTHPRHAREAMAARLVEEPLDEWQFGGSSAIEEMASLKAPAPMTWPVCFLACETARFPGFSAAVFDAADAVAILDNNRASRGELLLSGEDAAAAYYAYRLCDDAVPTREESDAEWARLTDAQEYADGHSDESKKAGQHVVYSEADEDEDEVEVI